jgi:hypothetical protein
MLYDRAALTATVGPDGRIYAIGGTQGFSGSLRIVEAYTPATNTWTRVASMPTGRLALAATTGPDDRIYAIGGENDTGVTGVVEAYTPATDRWSAVKALPTPRFGLGAVTAHDGRILAIGGFDSSNDDLDTVEAYTVPSFLTALGPAEVWVGIGDVASLGIRLDLRIKVYVNDKVVGVGQHDSVSAGLDPHFRFAKLRFIPLTLMAGPVEVPPDSHVKARLLVRNACSGSSVPSGTARLWYNGNDVDTGPDRDAGSRFTATITGEASDYFLRSEFVLDPTAGASRERSTVSVGEPCGSWIKFGDWTLTRP